MEVFIVRVDNENNFSIYDNLPSAKQAAVKIYFNLTGIQYTVDDVHFVHDGLWQIKNSGPFDYQVRIHRSILWS